MTKFYIVTAFLILLISCGKEVQKPLPKTLQDNGGLFLPDGFGALIVADSVGKARHMAVNSNGDIYVKLGLTGGSKGNVALRDSNGDGRADIIQRFGNYPNDGKFATEMRIHNGYLYYSSELVVYRQKLKEGQLIPNSKMEVILTDHHPVQWHNAKSLAFDGKGSMYVTFSAPTNVCEDWNSTLGESSAYMLGQYPCPELIDHAGIWKFDEDKPNQQQADGKHYATGLRSIVGISWNEDADALYAVQHGRDYLYGHAPQYYTPWQNATLPAEEFIVIKKGNHFGWPFAYYDPFKNKKLLAPEYGGDGIKEAGKFSMPLLGFPAHWAPNDLLFYKGDQFPDRYKNGAFIAFHGSTNRTPYPQGGYIIAFVPMKNGKPSGPWEVFADGFIGNEKITKMEEAHYRPMGLSEGADGSLYVCDSKVGKIWRIIYNKNEKPFSTDALVKMEARKNMAHLRIPDEIKDNLSQEGIPVGAEVYATHCQTCHQKNGEGLNPRYPPLANATHLSADPQSLVRTILHGMKGPMKVKDVEYNEIMPAYKFLSDEQVKAVADYILNNFGNRSAKITLENIQKIRKEK